MKDLLEAGMKIVILCVDVSKIILLFMRAKKLFTIPKFLHGIIPALIVHLETIF